MIASRPPPLEYARTVVGRAGGPPGTRALLAIIRLAALPVVLVGERLVERAPDRAQFFLPIFGLAAAYAAATAWRAWRRPNDAVPAWQLIFDVLLLSALAYTSGGPFSQAISDFFGALAPYMPPPPPGALPPPLWGSEAHVRELFGDRVESLEMTRGHYVERADSPRDYREFFKQTFGPLVGTYASLAEESKRAAALDQDLLEFATRANSGAPEGPAPSPTPRVESRPLEGVGV